MHALAYLQMKNDGGLVGIWLSPGIRGACAQFLCLPYGVSRPALLFLPFFSLCASSSTGRKWRWGYPFFIKRFALSLDVCFFNEHFDYHCLEMTEFSYLVRKGGWFPLLPPQGNTSPLPSPCFYVYACSQINHILFLICFLVCSGAFLLARLTVFLS